jgi:uncharacterized membrane protein YdbT with pleckstrin-like domain
MAALNLSPGERVIFQGHPSWRAILGFYLKGILIAALAGVVFRLFDAGTGTVFLVVVAIVAVTVLVGFLKRVSTTYTITDRRLNIRRGIVSREVQETRLERVQNVNYQQGVLDRLVGVGTVDFDTAGTDDSEFRFDWVNDPEGVVRTVDHAVEEARAGTLRDPQDPMQA